MSDPTQAEVDTDEFTVTSTSTSQAELNTEMERPEPRPATATDEAADEAADEADPKPAAAAGEKPGEKDKAKPTASTPGGRVAQLKAEIATLTHEKHRTRQQKDADEAALATARTELADLNRQLAEKRAQVKGDDKPADPKAIAKEPERAPEPKEDDFEDFREWVKAHGVWTREMAKLDAEEVVSSRDERARVAAADTEQKTQQDKLIAYRTELGQKHAARITEHETKNPGFQALMESAGALPTNPWIDEHILHSEHGPALMQYLAENPEECERISALGLGPTLVALGKIEARFDSAPPASEREPRPRTKVSPPVRAVTGNTSVAADDADADLATMEFGPDYVRRMNARDKQRRQARL